MGTKTQDAAGAEDVTGTEEVTGPHEATGPDEATGTDEATGAGKAAPPVPAENAATAEDATALEEPDAEDAAETVPAPRKAAGVGQGAAAVVSAALGVIGLSGGWLGTVAAARSNIVGQLETARSANVADQIQALYGDSWKITALIAGIFALTALVTGFVVLVRPAFGTPGQEQAPWIKSVAWAGVVLGVIGLILAVAKYTDLLLGLPSAPS